MLTGFGAGLTNKRLFSRNPVVTVISTMGLTVFCEIVFLMANPRPLVYILKIVTGEVICNGIAALIVNIVMQNMETNKKNRLAIARARF